MKLPIAAAALATGIGLLAAAPAQARVDVGVVVGVPGVAVSSYYEPAPVYYGPTYYAPPPVYYGPPRVVVHDRYVYNNYYRGPRREVYVRDHYHGRPGPGPGHYHPGPGPGRGHDWHDDRHEHNGPFWRGR